MIRHRSIVPGWMVVVALLALTGTACGRGEKTSAEKPGVAKKISVAASGDARADAKT